MVLAFSKGSKKIADEGFRIDDVRLTNENLFGQDAMDFFVGIETTILDDDAVEVEIRGLAHGRKHDPARRDPEESKARDALRAKDHLKVVPRKGAYPVLDDDDLVGLRGDGLMKLRRFGPVDEAIRLPNGAEDGMRGGDLWVSGTKTDSHVNHGDALRTDSLENASGRRKNSIGAFEQSDNAFLAIEDKHSGALGIQFFDAHFAYLNSN